jgi:hypothetical protein
MAGTLRLQNNCQSSVRPYSLRCSPLETYTDAFCALNAPAPLLSILAADIVLVLRLPGQILVTSERGVID